MGEMVSNCTLKHKNRENKLEARVGRPGLERYKLAMSDTIVGIYRNRYQTGTYKIRYQMKIWDGNFY